MKKNKNFSLARKLILVVVCLTLFLSLVQLAISHQLATAGKKIRLYEEEIGQIEEESRILKEEVSKLSSLSRISQKAEELGFLRTTQVLHLTPQVSVALK